MKENNVILKYLYPKISKSLSANYSKLKRTIGKFIDKNSVSLYDIAPYSMIPFTLDDYNEFFKAINISEAEIVSILEKTYYYDIPNFNPIAAKNPFTIAMIMVIRYFIMKGKTKEQELCSIYLSFSGKFYPSIFHGSFPKFPPSENKSVMEFVVNNKLSQQFDLKREGNIINSIKSRANTWLNKYKSRFKDCEDDDVVYVVQQLHDRIKSFMINIAQVYYEVYKNKDSYLNYESDSLGEEDYRITDNDISKIERAVERTMNKINGVNADYSLCKTATDANKTVTSDELKNIIELILQNNDNLNIIKELIRILITLYFQTTDKKDLSNVRFISTSIQLKPNTKNKYVLRQKEILNDLLDDNSPAYRRRKHRLDTKNAYNKALLYYIVLLIFFANN